MWESEQSSWALADIVTVRSTEMSWKSSSCHGRALKKLCKYSVSKFFNENGFLSAYWVFLQDSSVLTAREEGILQAQHVWGEMWARDGGSLSLQLMELSWPLQIRTERGRGLGRKQQEPGGLAEHNQHVRAAWGRTSWPGLAADSSSGVGLSQKWGKANGETIIAVPGKFLYMTGPSFASAFLGSLS